VFGEKGPQEVQALFLLELVATAATAATANIMGFGLKT
jgi:hypothetical protein